MIEEQSVLITETNPALKNLQRSWKTAEFTKDDGIAPMRSLYEAGDSIVAVAQLSDNETVIIGSGVMIGPGLLLTATHVLDEFRQTKNPPAFLTFLPDATRCWLPKDSSNLSKPSSVNENRKAHSDLTLLSCTLNSNSHEKYPLTLAPLQIALPLFGERLWTFGYRHELLNDNSAILTPFVSSGCVSAVYPQGRGERMPAPCVEVAMDTKGGMSGGPVVNTSGNVIGIVSSSFEGGATYVTLIWDALKLAVKSTLPPFDRLGQINLFAARDLGLVRLSGDIQRRRNGDVIIRMSDLEMTLLVSSIDEKSIARLDSNVIKVHDEGQRDAFEEEWSHDMESVAEDAAISHLKTSSVPALRELLDGIDIPIDCLNSIQTFTVERMEGLEDPEIFSIHENMNGNLKVVLAFDLLSVIITVKVPTSEYVAKATLFRKYFFDIEVNGENVHMQTSQRCYFEAELIFDQEFKTFDQVSIYRSGVWKP